MDRRHIWVLLRYDLRYSLRGPRGLLFLALYFITWIYILIKLANGAAAGLGKPEASLVLSWFIDDRLVQLVTSHPPTAAVYFVVAMTLTPWFAMLGACDQTATDLGTKHLRFLIPRCGRLEIYVGRFLGAVCLITAAQLLVGIASTIIALAIDDAPKADILAFGARATFTVLIYGIPFVAIMSAVSALVASAGLSIMLGLGAYTVLRMGTWVLVMRWSGMEVLGYIVPSGPRILMMQGESAWAIVAMAGMFLYTAAYWLLGWQIFRTRDA